MEDAALDLRWLARLRVDLPRWGDTDRRVGDTEGLAGEYAGWEEGGWWKSDEDGSRCEPSRLSWDEW